MCRVVEQGWPNRTGTGRRIETGIGTAKSMTEQISFELKIELADTDVDIDIKYNVRIQSKI
jgi:hypothetical protein